MSIANSLVQLPTFLCAFVGPHCTCRAWAPSLATWPPCAAARPCPAARVSQPAATALGAARSSATSRLPRCRCCRPGVQSQPAGGAKQGSATPAALPAGYLPAGHLPARKRAPAECFWPCHVLLQGCKWRRRCSGAGDGAVPPCRHPHAAVPAGGCAARGRVRAPPGLQRARWLQGAAVFPETLQWRRTLLNRLGASSAACFRAQTRRADSALPCMRLAAAAVPPGRTWSGTAPWPSTPRTRRALTAGSCPSEWLATRHRVRLRGWGWKGSCKRCA